MYIYIYICITRELANIMFAQQEGTRNRTEQAEVNGTEPCNSGTGRNRTRKRTEPNRPEPRRARKTQAEPRRTGTIICPNRTEPNYFGKFRNHTGSFLFFAGFPRLAEL